MPLPAPLLRRNPKAHKNQFGHVLILAGSPTMLGAAALSGLAAMRSGAGLVTLGVPKSLNLTLQKKISPVIMTWPLPETSQQTFSLLAYQDLKKRLNSFQAIAIGPGLSQNTNTQRFILKVIENVKQPLVIDADALNAISENTRSLTKISNTKVLTPHPGEMARLTHLPKVYIEGHRQTVAKDFAKTHKVILLLKGHETIVASADGEIYVNKTGNPGMATAGSGDVLTGMIAAFLAQGLSGFEAAKWAAFLHGRAGDLAAKAKTKISIIAMDIVENIPRAMARI
jgi:hydroxyethylthiazole kinase-like uncharacterized protein yjeF